MDDELEQQFVESLSPFERCALQIAKTQLGSSFNLQKCNGFVEFLATLEKEKKHTNKKMKVEHIPADEC
jgi:hypothetical protein